MWLSAIASLKNNRFYYAPYGLINVSVSECFTKLSLFYGVDKGLAFFKQRMKLAVSMKDLSNYHLALMCFNMIICCTIIDEKFFIELPVYCRNLMLTLRT